MKRVSKYTVQLIRESCKTYDIIDTVIDNSALAKKTVSKLIDVSSWHNEKVGIVCLNVNNGIIGFHIIAEGSLVEAQVSIREIVLRVLLNNAHSVILFHNHPSGNPTPSSSDIHLTKRVKEAFDLLNIKLLDHIIVTTETTVSLTERGVL